MIKVLRRSNIKEIRAAINATGVNEAAAMKAVNPVPIFAPTV